MTHFWVNSTTQSLLRSGFKFFSSILTDAQGHIREEKNMARGYEYADVPPKCINTLDNNNAHRNRAKTIAIYSALSDKRKSHLVLVYSAIVVTSVKENGVIANTN
jgi:hypothetical protein